MKFHIKNHQHANIAGFAAKHIKVGENISLVVSNIETSDDDAFHAHIDSVFNLFIGGHGIPPGVVSNFLIVIHQNKDVDVFVNEFPVRLSIIAKNQIEHGQVVKGTDIADITKVSFSGIQIDPKDRIIGCLKVGWKFLFFFHLTEEEDLDMAKYETELARFYRYLAFEDELKIVENDEQYDRLLKAGWFPFIRLLGGDYKRLEVLYKDEEHLPQELDRFLAKFDADWVKKLTDRWWVNPLFKNSQEIIQEGLDAFVNKNYVCAISTLMLRIEGLLRHAYKDSIGADVDKMSLPKLCEFLKEKGASKTKDDFSLFLAQPFFEYLQKNYLPGFSVDKGEAPYSRHSLGHGVLEKQDFSHARALQTILILEQIFFYIN